MRFLHTADWHIGKKMHGYELLEEQQHAFEEIVKIAENEQVDAIVIAGDLYDRSVPSVEAIELFNQMIIKMNLDKKFPVLAISGNHDSSIRIETGGPWFIHSNFHLHTRLEQAFEPIEYNDTQFFLLPYFEPISARLYFENDAKRTIQQAMEAVIEKIKSKFDPKKSHVLVSHFFVAGSEKTESETKLTVGGLDIIPASLLASFDYVALGHLHGKNALHLENARYSGSPIKFSLSEIHQEKGVWIVDTNKNETSFTFKKIQPLRDICQIKGLFKEITLPNFYEQVNRENYLHIQLTDRAVIPNMMSHLRKIYPKIIGVERLNGREKTEMSENIKKVTKVAPVDLITQFFEKVTSETITDQQKEWVEKTLGVIYQEERGK